MPYRSPIGAMSEPKFGSTWCPISKCLTMGLYRSPYSGAIFRALLMPYRNPIEALWVPCKAL